MSFKKRTEKVIDWLTGKNPPNFVAVYFEEPDKTCHHQRWSDLPEAIERVDKTVGLIVDGLKRHELLDKVKIIITADHGMANISCNKVIDLDKYVDPENYDFWDSWFNMLLAPKAGKMEAVYKRLKSVIFTFITKMRFPNICTSGTAGVFRCLWSFLRRAGL